MVSSEMVSREKVSGIISPGNRVFMLTRDKTEITYSNRVFQVIRYHVPSSMGKVCISLDPRYVCKSDRLRERIQEHERNRLDHYSEFFTFPLAKEKTPGELLDAGLPRLELEEHPEFTPLFVGTFPLPRFAES